MDLAELDKQLRSKEQPLVTQNYRFLVSAHTQPQLQGLPLTPC